MSPWIAALPMYDWPETSDKITKLWTEVRDGLRQMGVDAPDQLVRRNADMPAVPGGIRDIAGILIAPDPAELDPDALDLDVLWRHPSLLLGETCWGPMELGLGGHTRVLGQNDYAAYTGGRGIFYRSVLVMHRKTPSSGHLKMANIGDGLPISLLRNCTFAFNDEASRSGFLALDQDLRDLGLDFDIFKSCLKTGSHRRSMQMVADGQADVAAIDCRSFAHFQVHDAYGKYLKPVGWTTERVGLPFICSNSVPIEIANRVESCLLAVQQKANRAHLT